MKSIKYGKLRTGMKLTMLRWVKLNDRRISQVEILHIEGVGKETRGEILTEKGTVEPIYHNGSVMVMKVGKVEQRVTFRIEPEKNEMFFITGKQVVLADKNGELATWNNLGDGFLQLPDDECCNSYHTVEDLLKEGYSVHKD